MSGSSSQSPALNMISEGTTLKGTLNSKNDIRIAGQINGETISEGKLIVTSSGVVEGEVKVADADIAGKVEGDVRVKGKLNLRQTAIVNGDIYTKTLIVEEGAQMNGACKMGDAPAKSKASSPDGKNDASSDKAGLGAKFKKS